MQAPSKKEVKGWSVDVVGAWLVEKGFSEKVVKTFKDHAIDGSALLELNEEHLKSPILHISKMGDLLKLNKEIKALKNGIGIVSLQSSERGIIGNLSRAVFSLAYLLCACFVTALTMTVVHAKVPDQENYPPLPDVVLNNIPHIHWAFDAVEYISLVLACIFIVILIFHRYRVIVVSRFSVIIGTVFFFRCITMWVTSLSVPGHHLDCDQNRVNVSNTEEIFNHAWKITRGMGMATQGVRTCGDYMFSGHTIVLTMLNCVINQYTPDRWRGLHIAGYVLNLFGMFLILAAHEHYTIDVIIAFYITNRMFDYYHMLADAKAGGNQGKDIYFSFFAFAYVEDGLLEVPNQYEYPWEPILRFFCNKRITKFLVKNKIL